MFLHLSVILFTEGAGFVRKPPTGQRLPRQRSPRSETPPWTETPRTEIPLDRDPPDRDPPGQRSPPRTVTSGWYASYWKAFLFFFLFCLEDINPFCAATDTPVLDFWWRLLWVSEPGWIPSLPCFIAYAQRLPFYMTSLGSSHTCHLLNYCDCVNHFLHCNRNS